MVHGPARLKRLTSTPSEMEAGVIVATLEENGIKATFNGQSTSGFRAEAPGWVQVLVAEEDVPRAQALLDEVRDEDVDVDWSSVDVGEPDEVEEVATVPSGMRFSLWRRIAFVLVMIYLTYLIFAFGATVLSLIGRALD